MSAADVQATRLHMKPLLKKAKELGYACAQVNTENFCPLFKKYDIKSTSGAVFFANGQYAKHVEKIDDSVFLPVSNKPDAMHSLPVYPMMKPDAVDADSSPGIVGIGYPMLKPDEPSPAYATMKPDDVVQKHSAPTYQKPNQIDMSSDAFEQYRYHKALPQMPGGQANTQGVQSAATKPKPQPKPQQSADLPVNDCACIIL
ncbi:hypothetical protein GGF43_002903 [Coemansia sp. RSA 2618]|nr:hypothetical protein GGF43_002903 [Coemansia sp. RSA 2618]